MMDVPHLEGVVVQPSSSRKRKRSTRPMDTPERGIVEPSSRAAIESTLGPSNGLEAEGAYLREESTSEMPQIQAQVTTQSNQHTSEDLQSLADDYEYEDYGDDDTQEGEDFSDGEEGEDFGDGEEGEDFGDGEQGEGEDDEMDEHGRPGCVEGRIDLGAVHAYLYGEENRKFRSKVWNEYTKVRVGGIVTKGQCIHCNIEISAKRGAGTSALITHLKRCKIRRSVTNMARQLKSVVMSPEGVALENWRFSQDVSRRELTRMITLHGLPLAIVDYDGFRRFVSSLNPVFKVVSRKTITGDCMKKFQEQKQILQEVFRGSNSRVSLTMDMWTSNQTVGYMCITCHFLDDNWKMHKRIVKFCHMKTPHTGVAMFNEVLKFIQEWNIEDKIFAITLDNASNNNAMVRLLRSNLLEKQMLCGKGRLFHHRCAAHVLNLICKAGFEIINPIVHKIRESMKFIHGSTSRKQKFEEIIQQLGIIYRRRPNLDIATRWNSTYLMLEICLELKRAFESLAQQDPEYNFAPSLQEWDKARVVSGFLKTFYDATKVISGSLYPTANLYFHEIWEVKIALDNGVPDANVAELSETIEYMQRKFKRYWKLTWLQISFPVIFDPRFKFGLVEFRLKKAFGSEGESKVALLKKVLLDLFKDYSQESLGNPDATQQIATAEVVTNVVGRYADWEEHLSRNASSTIEVPSELESYLKKDPIPRTDTLDILSWWKSNSVEYPTLSRMARDVLAVPASTVASESAFSTGRRIISDLRSRLTPKNVEALICVQDWIRASGSSEFQMEGIEDYIELPDQQQ